MGPSNPKAASAGPGSASNISEIAHFTEIARAPRRGYRRPIGVMIRGHYEVCDALILSENGILFQTLNAVAIGTILLCTLIMPGGASIVVKSKVVFQKKVGSHLQLGAGFLNLEVASRRKVRSYVAAKKIEEMAAEEI